MHCTSSVFPQSNLKIHNLRNGSVRSILNDIFDSKTPDDIISTLSLKQIALCLNYLNENKIYRKHDKITEIKQKIKIYRLTLADSELPSKEREFGHRLKKLCESHEYLKGKFVERPDADTSDIFCEFGLYYHDKANLNESGKSEYFLNTIQCVGLLCAAYIRASDQSKKSQLQKYLNTICYSVLEKCDSAQPDSDLLQLARDFNQPLRSMRKISWLFMKTMKHGPPNLLDDNHDVKREYTSHKIKRIDLIKKEITKHYMKIVTTIYQKCFSIMGDPPCKYCVLGLGSLARGEITPYSDFEHVVILENQRLRKKKDIKNCKDYFRRVALLFSIVLIMFNETLIPCLNIPALNDTINGNSWFYDNKTRSGLTIDGLVPHACMGPLGRMEATHLKPFLTEFIGTVDEMASYLGKYQQKRNGYHISNALMHCVNVCGDKGLFNAFEEKINQSGIHSTPHVKLINDLPGQVWRSSYSNIKDLLYRTFTLTISACGQRFSIYNKSSVEVIKLLEQKGYFTEQESRNYQYLDAIITQLRYKRYALKNKQDDVIFDEGFFKGTTSSVVQLFNDLGFETSTTIDLFTHLTELQFKAAGYGFKHLNILETKFKFLNFLECHYETVSEWKNLRKSDASFSYDILENTLLACQQENNWFSSHDEHYNECVNLMFGITEDSYLEYIRILFDLTSESEGSSSDDSSSDSGSTTGSSEETDYGYHADSDEEISYDELDYICEDETLVFIEESVERVETILLAPNKYLPAEAVNELEEALTKTLENVELLLKDGNHDLVRRCYANKGDFELSIGNFQQAHKYYGMAVQIAEKDPGNVNFPELIELLNGSTRCSLHLDNDQDTVKTLDRALNLLIDNPPRLRFWPQLEDALNLAGWFFYIRGDFSNARAFFSFQFKHRLLMECQRHHQDLYFFKDLIYILRVVCSNDSKLNRAERRKKYINYTSSFIENEVERWYFDLVGNFSVQVVLEENTFDVRNKVSFKITCDELNFELNLFMQLI